MADPRQLEAVDTWHEIDPWGASPHLASRLSGLGGPVPSPDPGFVFSTAFFTIAPGPFRMRLVFEGHHPSDAAFLLEISNRSCLAGSPTIRMRLALAPLTAILEAEGQFDIVIEAETKVEYALAGFLHTPHVLEITGLRIFVDRPLHMAIATEAIGAPPASDAAAADAVPQTRDTARLVGTGQPSFTNPYSQPWTPIQLHEAAFAARCADLGLASDAPQTWSEAFVLQTLIKYGSLAPGRSGIGFDCGGQSLPWSLSRDARILMTRFDEPTVEADLGKEWAALSMQAPQPGFAENVAFTTLAPHSLPPGYHGVFDFAWWIAPHDIAPAEATHQLSAVTTALKSGGIAVLVIPYHPNAYAGSKRVEARTVTRTVIERFALEVIAQGHSVAQLRFGTILDMPAATQFGIIVARS